MIPNWDLTFSNESVIQLFEILNLLSDASIETDPSRFRNPNGVAMKLSSFARFDDSYGSAGLTRVGVLEGEICSEFAGRKSTLEKEIFRIRSRLG